MADSTGTTVWRWDQQEPFGNNPADEDPDANTVTFDLPLRLPGQRYDAETALHYNYFRDYDPSIGIYKQSDPIGLRARLNTYAYVAGSPLMMSDPSGLKATCYQGMDIRCHSDQLPPTDKIPAPLPKDPRDGPSGKPDEDFCARTQATLPNCQQCCTRIAQRFRDAAFVSPCNVACNDKFACKPNSIFADTGLPPDLLLLL